MKKFFKKSIVIFSFLLLIILTLIINYKINHRFNDSKVIGHTEEEIVKVYGKYRYWDSCSIEKDSQIISKIIYYKAYEDRGFSFFGIEKFFGVESNVYYWIYLNESGIAVDTDYRKKAAE